MKEIQTMLLDVLQRDTAYATGCTDPIGIALAAAAAKAAGNGQIKRIEINVSPNIFKNAMGVGIPGTKQKGIDFAAAMGIVAGRADAGLDVLNQVNKGDSDRAAALLQQAETVVNISDNGILLYIDVRIDTDTGWARAIIEDDYDRIVRVSTDQKEEVLKKKGYQAKTAVDLSAVKVQDIFDFTAQIPVEKLAFLKAGADANFAAAEQGIKTKASFGLGSALAELHCKDPVLNAFLKARTYTAGASDARMAGFPVRIMTVAGSGNHGITALLSVLAVWESEGFDEEKLLRGLALSALMTIYIKWHVKRMSAFCGCAVAAATGAAAGITRMLGGSEIMAAGAMNSIMGSLTGMICDGAKESCSYKVSVAAGEAVLHSYLSTRGVSVSHPGGIVSYSLKESFLNMGLINDPGMKVTDQVILEITKNVQDQMKEKREEK